jgi:5-methylcytosine-specific restriction endonuclease McrA
VKRLNPETNQPFERGYKREDGRYFYQYTPTKVKRNGFFEEKWLSKEALDHYREKQREVKKIHAKNNPDKVNAKSNNRRAKKLKRTPVWIKDKFLKEIAEYYTMAKELETVFPWKQHVDHIVPMNGKNVSGLHVPWNLQILSKKENLEKGNKHVC